MTNPVMRFDILCTVWGCPSRFVFLMPTAETIAETVKLSQQFSYAHGWRIDRIGTLCAAHVNHKVGKLTEVA